MKHKRIWSGAVVGLVALAVGLVSASASAQNLTQGYLSDSTIQNGMIVRLAPKDTSKVEILKRVNMSDMLGVATAATEAPVSISNPEQKQVFVATYGRYDVLVSNENDVIKPGDFITISSVDGVGMRADGDDEIILGKALIGFAGTNDFESTLKLQDNAGGERVVAMKRIPVELTVARSPIYTGDTIAGVPNFLSSIARSVTKKPVTALRIYACLGVLILALTIAGGVMYSGIRTGMTAVGRNPLAKKAIVRNLITVILMSLIIVAIGLTAVYLLLRI